MRGLGAPDPAAAQQALIRQVREAAIKTAAAQTGVSVGLLFVPVVGWAVSALVGIVNLFTARHYQKDIKETIRKLQVGLQKMATDYQLKLDAAQEAVYDQERQRVADEIDRVGVAGLGDLGLSIKSVARKVGHAVAKAAVAPVQKGGAAILSAVGAKKAAGQFDRMGDRAAGKLTQVLTQPKTIAQDVQTAGRMITGEEAAYQAKRKASDVYRQAHAQMEASYQAQLVAINGPEFHRAMHDAIAEQARTDPAFAKALRSLPRAGADPTSATAQLSRAQSGGLLAAVAAATFAVMLGKS